jgi:hypothetical protein
MKPDSPPVLRATRLLDQVREQVCSAHYSFAHGVVLCHGPFIIERRLCSLALTGSLGPKAEIHRNGGYLSKSGWNLEKDLS